MSIKGQCHSLTLVKGHSDFKVKCLTFGLYNQVSDSGPQGPLVCIVIESESHVLLDCILYTDLRSEFFAKAKP